MNASPNAQPIGAAARLTIIAQSDCASEVLVSAEDLRELLALAAKPQGNMAPELHARQVGTPGTSKPVGTEAEQQIRLLGQALGECIAAAGIVRDDVGMTGPELLMFADDLKQHLEQEHHGRRAYNAVIGYMLANPCESPLEFLNCWNEGNFDALRNEWPDAPKEIYAADSQHPDFKHLWSSAPNSREPLTGITLLSRCQETLNELLASDKPIDAAHADQNKALVDAITDYLEPLPFSEATSRIRDDFDAEAAYVQYRASAEALVRAVARTYPLNMPIRVKAGNSVITGEVVSHLDCWWSNPGQFVVRNSVTGKLRKVMHSDVRPSPGDASPGQPCS